MCHVALFSSFVVGFGFEHVARAYASSRSSLFVILLRLVSVSGAYTTMRTGNLLESSEYFGRSLSWLAAFRVPFCTSAVQEFRPFHCASLPAGIVITLFICILLFKVRAHGNSSKFSCVSRRSIVDTPLCADRIAFWMALVASAWAEGSGVGLGVPEVIARMPFCRHGTEHQSGFRPCPWCMYSSFIFHRFICSLVREFGINVGGSVKGPLVKNSGLIMCWHVVLVYLCIQFKSAIGVSAARWVYFSGLLFGL